MLWQQFLPWNGSFHSCQTHSWHSQPHFRISGIAGVLTFCIKGMLGHVMACATRDALVLLEHPRAIAANGTSCSYPLQPSWIFVISVFLALAGHAHNLSLNHVHMCAPACAKLGYHSESFGISSVTWEGQSYKNWAPTERKQRKCFYCVGSSESAPLRHPAGMGRPPLTPPSSCHRSEL